MSGTYNGTQAFVPAGTQIKFSSLAHTGTPTYDKTLGEVTGAKQDAMKVGSEDATNMQSLLNTKEFIPGMIDPGSFSFDFNYLPNDGGQAALLTLAQGRITNDWELVFPPAPGFSTSAGTIRFAGLVEEYGPFNFPPDKKATGAVKVKVSGPITTVAGS